MDDPSPPDDLAPPTSLAPLDSTVYVRIARGRTPGESVLLPFRVIGYAPPRCPSAKRGPTSLWRYVLEGSRGGVMTRVASSVYAEE